MIVSPFSFLLSLRAPLFFRRYLFCDHGHCYQRFFRKCAYSRLYFLEQKKKTKIIIMGLNEMGFWCVCVCVYKRTFVTTPTLLKWALFIFILALSPGILPTTDNVSLSLAHTLFDKPIIIGILWLAIKPWVCVCFSKPINRLSRVSFF